MPHFLAKRYSGLMLALLVLVLGACSSDKLPDVYGKDEVAPPRQAYEPPARDWQAESRAPSPLPSFYPAGSALQQEVKIALLLPFSGKDAAMARSLLDAATLALYDKYASIPAEDARVKITLLPRDTLGTEEGAVAAAREALAEGAKLILGPLYSSSALAVLPMARERGVQVISFSNNPALAGRGLFQFGFMAEEQVERVVQYAWREGYTAFAAMAPESAYGKQALLHFQDLITTRSGRVHPLETYPEEATNLPYQTARMVRVLLKDNTGKQALFMPESGDRLNAILNSLLQRRAELAQRHFKLLGTGLWDDEASLKLRGLQGAWFASSPPQQYRQFEMRFISTYGYRPQRLASLAYDATALATTMALAPSGADFSARSLSLPSGYSGPANGVFRFLSDGTCQRNLAVMEITPGGFKVIDAAPLSFAK